MDAAETSGKLTAADRRHGPRGRIWLLAFLILVVVPGCLAFRGVGRWLVREDPIAQADVIVVLSGGMPQRAQEAANLFRKSYAPEVWVSRPESPASQLSSLGIRFVGEEEYNREILVHEGVPESAVHIFTEPIIDTEQEIAEAAREMKRTGKSKVIIVTSPEHTRRVHALWGKLVGADPKLIVRAAAEDPFDADHWWRNTRDAFAVVRELLGLFNVWAGLPLRPHSP